MSEQNTLFVIRPASKATNLETLRPVLESAIRHPLTQEIYYDEVEAVLAQVIESTERLSDRSYLVAESLAGLSLGVMGLQIPETRMREFALTPKPGEIINAYVDQNQRDMGIGKTLLQGIEQAARDKEFSEVLVNSGPRYQLSGWPFWIRMYGEPVEMAKDYYGPGYAAAVWRKSLAE